ncbi:MAG: hypothetical protein U0L05_01325 [Schaedlerella sp.]|nr:hypothetical protein [Schaedlerella sp.]
MKKILCSLIALLGSMIMVACAEEVEYEPTALVIKTLDMAGTYDGTICISGEDREEICVEGIMRIEADGKKVRVTMSDAVDSLFDQEF